MTNTPEQEAVFEQGICNVCQCGVEYGWTLEIVLRAVKYHTPYWDKARMPARLRQHIADVYGAHRYAAAMNRYEQQNKPREDASTVSGEAPPR